MICPKCKSENSFSVSSNTFENQNITGCFQCDNCNCIVTKNNVGNISNIYYDLYLFPDED